MATNKVQVRNAAGVVQSFAPDKVQAQLDLGGELVTAGDRLAASTKRAAKRKASTPEEKAKAVGEAALSGVTGGIGNAILADKGIIDTEKARARKEELGGLGTAIEVGTSVGSALLGGGFLQTGRLAGLSRVAKFTPVGALSAGSRVLGKKVTERLGARTGAALVGLGIEGAVEGGLFSAANVISELALNDKPITTEAIAGGVFSGAGLGALAGGGAFALGKLGNKITEARRAKLFAKSDETSMFARSVDDHDVLIQEALRKVDVGVDSLEHTAAMAGRKQRVNAEALASVQVARNKARKALGGELSGENLVKFVRKQGLTPESIQAVKHLDDYYEQAKKVVGPEYREALDVATKNFTDTFNAGLAKQLGINPTKLDKLFEAAEIAEVAELAGVDIDGVIGPAGGNLIKGLAVIGLGKRVTGGKGVGLLGSLVKGGFSRAGGSALGDVARKAGASGVAQAAARGVGNVGARKSAASLLDGDLIQAVKAQQFAKGRIGRAISKTGKTLGRSPTANVAIHNLFNDITGEETRAKPPNTSKVETYVAKIKKLNAIMGNPELLAERANALTDGLRLVDPELAALARDQILKGTQFLHSLAPQDPGTMNGLMGSEWQPDEFAIDEWMDTVEMVSDPSSVVEMFAASQLTPQAAEVLKTVAPAHFAEMQRRLLDDPKVVERLSYEQRVQLGFLFDVTTDPMIAITGPLQDHFSEQENQGQEQPMTGVQPAPPSAPVGDRLSGAQNLTLNNGQ